MGSHNKVAVELLQRSMDDLGKSNIAILSEIKEFREEFKKYTCDNDDRVMNIEKDIIGVKADVGLKTIIMTIFASALTGIQYMLKR